MAQKIYLDRKWRFNEKFEEEMINEPMKESKLINIPHTVKETPLSYFDESVYQMVSGYQKSIFAPMQWDGKVVRLVFEAVGHSCDIYINGKHVKHHNCGYTAITCDVSELLKYGEENLITVKVNSKETLNQPPFGYVIDYMTYGGIYRDVYLDVKEPLHIKHVFIHTDRIREINIGISEIELSSNAKNDLAGMKLSQHIRLHGSGEAQAFHPLQESDASSAILSFTAPDTQLWAAPQSLKKTDSISTGSRRRSEG